MKTRYSNGRNPGGGGKKSPKPDLISRPVALPEETSPDNLGNLLLLL